MTAEGTAVSQVEGTEPTRGHLAWLGSVCVVLGAILLIVANVGYWAQSTVLDSDEFTSKVEDVLKEPETSDRIGAVLAQQVVDSGTLQTRIAEALPENATFVAVLIEGQLLDVLTRLISRAVSLDATQAVVTTAVGRLHDLVVSTLEGRRERLSVEQDGLVLDLQPVVSNVFARLGIEEPARLQEAEAGRVVLVEDASNLELASTAVKAIETLVPILFVLALAAFAARIFLWPNREGGLRGVGYGIVVAGVLSLFIWKIATWAFGTFLEEFVVTRRFLDSLIDNLKAPSIAMIILGALIVLAADERVRSSVTRFLSGAREGVENFGVGRTVLVGAGVVSVLLLVS